MSWPSSSRPARQVAGQRSTSRRQSASIWFQPACALRRSAPGRSVRVSASIRNMRDTAMRRRRLLLSVLALSFAILTRSAPAAETADARRPNVVFIMADDLGYTDVACYGTRYYETPHIDRLAAQGVRFTDGYTCGPNCQPTRAALMSGQYGPRTGVYTVGSIERFNWRTRPLRPVDNVQQLPPEKVTLAQSLKSAGYATALFGKWHLGEQGEFHPSNRGFDEAIVSAGQHVDFVTRPKVDYPPGTYLADF